MITVTDTNGKVYVLLYKDGRLVEEYDIVTNCNPTAQHYMERRMIVGISTQVYGDVEGTNPDKPEDTETYHMLPTNYGLEWREL